MKKVPTATFSLRDRYIVSIERVYTPSTFYMKSAVCIHVSHSLRSRDHRMGHGITQVITQEDDIESTGLVGNTRNNLSSNTTVI